MSHLSFPGTEERTPKTEDDDVYNVASMETIVRHNARGKGIERGGEREHTLKTNTAHIAGHFLIYFIKGDARFSTFDKWGRTLWILLEVNMRTNPQEEYRRYTQGGRVREAAANEK